MAMGALPCEFTMSEQPPQDLDWSPLVPGGAAFKTHRLVVAAATRIELHPSAQPEHFGDGGVFDQIYKPGN